MNDDFCLYYIRNKETRAVLGYPDYPTTWGNPTKAKRIMKQWNRRDARINLNSWELVKIDLRTMTIEVIETIDDRE